MKKISMLVLAFGMILGMVLPGEAQEKAADKPVVTTAVKEVQGEISGIGKDYISLIYQKDQEKGVEYEIYLPLEPDIKLVNKRELKQLNPGDIVRVQYQETTEQSKSGPKASWKTKTVTFVKPAVKR